MKNNDSVVVVDSETFAIELVDVGSRPTHLATLSNGSQSKVAVLNLDSDEVTLLKVNSLSDIDSLDIPIRPGHKCPGPF